MKNILENIRDFSAQRDIQFLGEHGDIYKFKHNQILIDIKKCGNLKEDVKRIENVINENYGTGFAGAGSNCDPYLEYKILPLNHDLEQKTDKRTEEKNKKVQYNIQIGSFVSGRSKKTDEEYTGQVIRFSRTNYNDIISVYILARENGCIIPLSPESVHLSSPYPKERPNRSKMDLGNIGMTNLTA